LERILSIAPKVKSNADHKAEILEVLNKTIALVEADEIDTIVLIAASPSGYWRYETAGGRFTTEMIGRLEIIKAEWIRTYLKDL